MANDDLWPVRPTNPNVGPTVFRRGAGKMRNKMVGGVLTSPVAPAAGGGTGGWMPCCCGLAFCGCINVPTALFATIIWSDSSTTVVPITWNNPNAFTGWQTNAFYGVVTKTNCAGGFNFVHVTVVCSPDSSHVIDISVVCLNSSTPVNPSTNGSGFFCFAFNEVFNPNNHCNGRGTGAPFYMESVSGSPCWAHFDSKCVTASACAGITQIVVTE